MPQSPAANLTKTIGASRRRIKPSREALPGLLRQGAVWVQGNGIFFAFVALVIVLFLTSPQFSSWLNISVILLQISALGIMAVPGAMLILTRNVDLAVGSIMVVTSVVFGALVHGGTSILIAVIASMLVAGGWGAVQGYLVAYKGLSPIVVTLGGLAGVRGVAEMISNARTNYAFGPSFAFLGNGSILGLDTPIWLMAIIFAIGFVFWVLMPYGRYMTALGSDPIAAHALGIRTQRLPFMLYVASGLSAGLAGLILTSVIDASTLSIGLGMELNVITAIMLGGVAFTGGRGSIVGVLFGVGFIGVLRNGLVLLNISQFFSDVVLGAALITAAGLDVLHQRLERLTIVHPEELPAAAQQGDQDVQPVLPGKIER
jgi:ribose transport system permease protein